MEAMQFSIYCSGRNIGPHTIVSANIRNSDGTSEAAEWGSCCLEIGDRVEVEIIDADTVDPPEKITSFGTRIHPTEEDELFCSFCGKSQRHAKQMIRGPAANACDECIGILYESLG